MQEQSQATANHPQEWFKRILNSQYALAGFSGCVVLTSWYLWLHWSRAPIAALGLVGAIAGGFLFAYPVLGASLAAFLMLSNLTEFVPGSVSPLLAVTLLVVVIKKIMAGDTSWVVTKFVKWGMMFLLIHMLSILWAGSYRFLDWSAFYRVALIALLMSEVVKTPKDFIIVILGAQAGAILTGILTVHSAAEFYLTGAADAISGSVAKIESSRFFGIWFEPNTMALSQVPVVGLSLVLMRTRIGFWLRLISMAALGAGLVTIMLSLSRGAMLCTIAMLFAIVITDRYKYQIISAVTVLALIVIAILPIDIVGRMASLTSPKADNSIGERSQLIIGGIKMIEDSFPLGVGPGNYRLYSMDYANRLEHGMISHNGYIDVFSEAGLFGFACFSLALVSLFRSVRWRGRRLKSDTLFENLNVGFSSILIAMTLGTVFLSASEYPIFWMFYTLIALFPILFDTSKPDTRAQLLIYS